MSSFPLYMTLFIVCAAIIFWAGRKLSYYGDLLATKTGLGKAWIGLMLMASITSLPELMVGISSAAIVQSPDLAVGDVLGSCVFNLFILALMDAFVPKHKPILTVASQSHALAAAFGIILLGMAGLGLFLPVDIVITSWIGFTSVVFIVIYLASIRMIFLHEKKHAVTSVIVKSVQETKEQSMPMRQITGRLIFFALVIVLCGLTLPFLADLIAVETGLGKSFVGTLFLAASTSLPEMAVSIAAIRMGAIDLAVGNLLGSNIFNILILAIDDIFYTKGHLLKGADQVNLVSVFCAIIMSAIVIIGLTYSRETKRYVLAWDALLILIIYIINLVIMYNLNAA